MAPVLGMLERAFGAVRVYPLRAPGSGGGTEELRRGIIAGTAASILLGEPRRASDSRN